MRAVWSTRTRKTEVFTPTTGSRLMFFQRTPRNCYTSSLALSRMVDRFSRFKETTPLLSSTEFRTELTVCWTATRS
ncbi:unnamed protein product [Larinioides sclopetarius]|uniref:Uncharacterized protein n=1 Tax=Larinioides sclopetarius TaxID=280406 RepID=A0AAV2A0N5_9ARAC